ncbi:zinc ABC transporter substrate-binding protein ZnuA [Caviibacterium pharyngocola]|uniref:High-affinity zinc uptake system protein ZnuA n=1 Tax=Caviibacterium pharyngocola TaxID=28159 RepID=A0A2M8RUJ9_9PAST|nr:zinc ABC transporter substrate-binding protein ZnuA [Caviibacterium pharyngocola]PJG82560.1 zinc ABC transporter substrate-binding protein [Caviibacterium pharyngocola]
MTIFNRTFKQAALAAAVISFSAAASASVLTSIKPLGFIASSIAEGVTDTDVIVPAGASPHAYNLKPSDVQKIKSADLIVWIGEDVDMFLDTSVLRDIDRKKVVTVAEISSIGDDMLVKGEHHHHDHDHDHDAHKQDKTADHQDHKHADHHEHNEAASAHEHHHDKLSTNWHIWYSPEISQIVAGKIAQKLSEQYPDKKALIEQNLAEFNRTLSEQNEKIQQQLMPLHEKGFYVFHDAYTYFNQAYHLNQVGYFTINPQVAPGAKTLATIKEEIEEHKVACLFAEPQFTPKVIETLHKGTGVKVGRLDPMGDAVKLGKNSYANFLQYTADSYAECLK